MKLMSLKRNLTKTKRILPNTLIYQKRVDPNKNRKE
jgi:hypothetical protein